MKLPTGRSAPPESGDCKAFVTALQKLAPVRGDHKPRARVLDCGDGVGEVTALVSEVRAS